MVPASLWLMGGARMHDAVARGDWRRDGAPYRGRGRRQRVSELVSMGDGKKFQTPARPCYSTFMRDFAGR